MGGRGRCVGGSGRCVGGRGEEGTQGEESRTPKSKREGFVPNLLIYYGIFIPDDISPSSYL